MTSYNSTTGMITKEAGSGDFRSAPAVWVIENGKPVLVERASRPVKTSRERRASASTCSQGSVGYS